MIAQAKFALNGPRISFEPLQLSNIYTHFKWNNDPELNRLDSEFPYVRESLGDFKKRFEQMVHSPCPNSQDFEIHTREGELIGIAYLAEISEHNSHCSAGITIGNQEFWGKGYGREALTMLLDYCFEEIGMHRVAVDTFEYNEAWRKLVQWAGFEREGCIRDYLFRCSRATTA
jgi:RimJ/RimL family protein N-acetyltransferase